MLEQRPPKTNVASLLVSAIIAAWLVASANAQPQADRDGPASTNQQVSNRAEQVKKQQKDLTEDYIASLEASAAENKTNSETVSFVRVLTSLVLVVGLAYLTMLMIRKYGGVRGIQPQEQHVMRVVGNLSLGPGRALHLVEVGSKKLVIGSTTTTITMLAELAEGDLPSALRSGSPEQHYSARSFKDQLAFFLGIGDAESNIESSRRIAHLLRDTAAFILGKRSHLAAIRGRLHNG